MGDCGAAKDKLQYKVGFLGVPLSIEGKLNIRVEWNEDNLRRLKALGFNTIQLAVAWGCRPDDEPLNLEDIVELPPDIAARYPQSVPLRCDPSPERRAQRRADLRHRIALCKQEGLRTIFHFGAPFNAHGTYGDSPPNCLSDPDLAERYALLLRLFAKEFPGVDDILVYTYDQDAWLCSEFGPCPRCLGVPLHERLVPFIERMKSTWRTLSPNGLLWWEPWELSAGQSYKCIERISPDGFGLALHCNTAEVMAALPVDRWFKNACTLAQHRGIPVIGEYFLGASSEELEPFTHLAHPLVNLRGLKALAAVPGVVGIKEYYGLAPDREDPNLRMAGIFFDNPDVAEGAALEQLAEPYGAARDEIIEFWRVAGEGMEMFPWDTSWMIRQVGRVRLDHSLTAATLRGMNCPTPSWCATRHAIFMRIEPAAPPHPWMLEDVQLRCELAARRMEDALAIGRNALARLSGPLAEHTAANLADLAGFARRAHAYAYHLRETNLARVLRIAHDKGLPCAPPQVDELRTLLLADYDNYRAENTAPWAEMDDALAALDTGIEEFLKKYLDDAPDQASKGIFSVTSR